ncbi:MAG: hypothetical protein E7491_09975 [Ruminococcaceae bacterium]|nr:hypothetical protein [Oscillospiraceae bacterium]
MKKRIRNITAEKIFKNMPRESRKALGHALYEAVNEDVRKHVDEIAYAEKVQHSKQHKIKMNRLFRERIRSSFIPFPEVDNLYEKARGKLITKFKIKENQKQHN